MPGPIVVGPSPLTLEQIVSVARRRRALVLSADAAWRARVQASAAFLERTWLAKETVYGVTTGYGDSCTVDIPPELVEALPLQLTRFHGCGLGAPLSEEATRAVIAVRLVSLARGLSGVRFSVLERLALLLEVDLLPLIPEEGSVGASGDLTPLSYLAAALIGEREVLLAGEQMSCAEAHSRLGLSPLVLSPKEGLALMNGTAVMTALACLAHGRAQTLAHLACEATALSVCALAGHATPFDARFSAAKAHPGQGQAARLIAQALAPVQGLGQGARLQDRYSVRCAPQVIGVLFDALRWFGEALEVEINSADDNPLIDADGGQILHGGNFYGGHVAFAMDGLKAAVASVADLLDRQIAVLTHPQMSGGLPANLSAATGSRATINHGFKALAIATSAWAAEALRLTMPAASFSRSTENHNQDKVPMGTLAARDALRVVELSEQVLAAALFMAAQGAHLRAQLGGVHLAGPLADRARGLLDRLGLVVEDRRLDTDLRALLEQIRADGLAAWGLG